MTPAKKRSTTKRSKRPKTADKSAGIVATIPQPHGGALLAGGVLGNRGGTGRPPSDVRALASAKLPRHVETLDQIAEGKVYVTMTEKCPECGHEMASALPAIPSPVKPGEQVRAVEALAKLADAKELVIASGEAASFFDCVHRAIVELFGESEAERVKQRAVKLMEATA